MPELPTKLKLPRLDSVRLRRFSLYAANPDASFSCNGGVLCLIGANGIGKSTLLSAITFAFTGIVGEPQREFQSMEEYYLDSRGFSKGYFRGRIAESDRAEAEIGLKFRVGDFTYEISRGMFEPDELRQFKITKSDSGDLELDTTNETRIDRQKKYEERIVSDIGLTSFSEFVFLQLFVFTFDERRVTLFWNQKILERALYLAFGFDPNMAKRVDDMQRDYESADSQVRNRQFDATRTRKRINELRAQSQSSEVNRVKYDAMLEEQDRLIKAHETELGALEALRNQVKDANLRLAALSAKESALHDEYTQIFERRLQRRPPLEQHPFLLQSIAQNSCGLCGASGPAVTERISLKLHASVCPICESPINVEIVKNDDLAQLQKLDKEISSTKRGIKEVLQELKRLAPEEERANSVMVENKAKLAEFERVNDAMMLSLRQSLGVSGGTDAMLASLRSQLDSFLQEKRDAESRRSELKRKLNDSRKQLESRYLSVEGDFVPVFRDSAHLFLGMPLEIRMVSSESYGVNLIIEVRGTSRRLPHQLSESQRFFLDIALRMALTKFISDPSTGGELYIDTPEGSLDIAYEKRAGEMLAKFVAAGQRVLMTANLNSSQLLLALAKNCGPDRMHLCLMTDWAELSEVQQEEEPLFAEALEKIGEALNA